MQTQPAISPLTGPGTGRLTLSAYGSQARESPLHFAPTDIQMRFPQRNQTQCVPKPTFPRTQNGRFPTQIPPNSTPNPNRCSNLDITPLD